MIVILVQNVSLKEEPKRDYFTAEKQWLAILTALLGIALTFWYLLRSGSSTVAHFGRARTGPSEKRKLPPPLTTVKEETKLQERDLVIPWKQGVAAPCKNCSLVRHVGILTLTGFGMLILLKMATTNDADAHSEKSASKLPTWAWILILAATAPCLCNLNIF